MKGEYFKDATQNFNHGNFEYNYPVVMDGIQDLLFKMHIFHYKHLRACRRDSYYYSYYYSYYLGRE